MHWELLECAGITKIVWYRCTSIVALVQFLRFWRVFLATPSIFPCSLPSCAQLRVAGHSLGRLSPKVWGPPMLSHHVHHGKNLSLLLPLLFFSSQRSKKELELFLYFLGRKRLDCIPLSSPSQIYRREAGGQSTLPILLFVGVTKLTFCHQNRVKLCGKWQPDTSVVYRNSCPRFAACVCLKSWNRDWIDPFVQTSHLHWWS